MAEKKPLILRRKMGPAPTPAPTPQRVLARGGPPLPTRSNQFRDSEVNGYALRLFREIPVGGLFRRDVTAPRGEDFVFMKVTVDRAVVYHANCGRTVLGFTPNSGHREVIYLAEGETVPVGLLLGSPIWGFSEGGGEYHVERWVITVGLPASVGCANTRDTSDGVTLPEMTRVHPVRLT